jgi:diphthamide biosynthesis enzyme Dph1/Dph2-like protein
VEFQELENFPFIEVFVNTACPRIGLEDQKKFPRPVVNLADVEELADNSLPGDKYPLTV